MKKKIEEFLAAPETLLQNEKEKVKATQRKAREEAREARLRAKKSKEVPSIEDLLSDLIRVAEDQETNPHHEFRSTSRRRYELYGHFPVEFVDRQFGQFDHALEVAGLRDQPGTRLWRAQRATSSRREHAARYVQRYVLPHYKKDPALRRKATHGKLVLSISDTHATFLDPFTWQCFLHAIRELKPDVVYMNGDVLEGAEISRFPKIPGWTVPLQLEFDFAREMFRQVREVAGHQGALVWGGGNHGIDRVAMYLTQVAPALANLRSLRIDKLAGLQDLNVELAQGGTIASPEGEEEMKSGMLLYGTYRIHHGTALGSSPGMSELKAAGRSGQSGHVHRASVVYGTNEADASLSWMTTPMGCTERAGRAYVRGATAGWQKGFGVCFIYPDGDVHQYPVVTDRDRCTVEGLVFRRKQNLPDPDPSRLWLPELKHE